MLYDGPFVFLRLVAYRFEDRYDSFTKKIREKILHNEHMNLIARIKMPIHSETLHRLIVVDKRRIFYKCIK